MSGRTLTWLRGALLGGAMVFTTALTGCLSGGAEPVDEGDETEEVGTAESELEGQTPAIDVPEASAEGDEPGGEVEGPDPLPWLGRPAGPEDPWGNPNSVGSTKSNPAP